MMRIMFPIVGMADGTSETRESAIVYEGVHCRFVVLLEYGSEDHKRAEVTSTVKFCHSEEEAKDQIEEFILNWEVVGIHYDSDKNQTVDEIIDAIDNYREFSIMNPQIDWTVWTSNSKTLDGVDGRPPWFREIIERVLHEYQEMTKETEEQRIADELEAARAAAIREAEASGL